MTDLLPFIFVFVIGVIAGMFLAALLIRHMVRHDGWQLIAPDDGGDEAADVQAS